MTPPPVSPARTREFRSRFVITALILVACTCAALQCGAQALASRSFDMLFAGDDPSESFTFLLSSNSSVPVIATFDGYFENLSTEETGVRYGLMWIVDSTTWDGVQFTGEMGVRLPGANPGTTQVSMIFAQPIAFTPSETRLWVEGLGPSDQFRFVGQFNIVPVPEPKSTALVGAAVVAALAACRRRATKLRRRA